MDSIMKEMLNMIRECKAKGMPVCDPARMNPNAYYGAMAYPSDHSDEEDKE